MLAIARTGSLSAAAAAMGLTAQAASAALKRAERQLGTRLFERTTRSVRPTADGQAWLQQAGRALELLDEANEQLADSRHEPAGGIRLAAPSDLCRSVLLPLLDDFMRHYPRVELVLSVGDRPLDLLRDEIDLAVRYGELPDARLVARLLARPSFVLCAAPSYLAQCGTPQTPAELRQHNCLVFHVNGRPHRLWRFERAGRWSEVPVRGDRSADDAALVHQWALAGAGITLKSGLDLQDDLRAGRLVPLLSDWRTHPYPLHALWQAGRFVPARLRALVDHLAQALASTDLALGPGSDNPAPL